MRYSGQFLQSKRNSKGTIAETGPVLFMLLIMLFFPLINIVSLSFSYFSCMTLNDLQSREAALLPASVANTANGPVRKQIPETWKKQGLGIYVGLEQDPATQVTYVNGKKDHQNRQEKLVQVTTSFRVRPFLSVPFFHGVPGLGAPVNFTIQSQRLLENFNSYNS